MDTPPTAPRRRSAPMRPLLAALLAATACLARPDAAAASEEAAWRALREGAIAIFRHANAPGGGDPPGMRLDDCATQRNLDGAGRAQARRIGDAFRSRGVAVGRVSTSAWCRTVETADIAFPGQGQVEAAFNSFFADRARGSAQTAAALAVLSAWRGPGSMVVATHQVNITALTGVFPASGEGVVVRMDGGRVSVIGRLRP
jgi:phosphohistidine phosphatase SixA